MAKAHRSRLTVFLDRTLQVAASPFHNPTVAKALWVTGVIGIVVTLVGWLLGQSFATNAGLGLTAASLLLALLLSAIQGQQLAEQSQRLTEQGQRLTGLATDFHRSLFNEVTLRIFNNIQNNELLNQRMHEGDKNVKQLLGPALSAISLNDRRTDFFGEFIARRNVFIESGSTYAYLSLEVNKYIKDKWHYSWGRPTIFTNNILVFMVLVFQRRCRARLYPGTPAGKYGASYGTGYKPDPIDPDHPEFMGIDKAEMHHFLVGQAQATIAKEEQPNSESVESQRFGIEIALVAASKLHLQFGPHVGSEENVCFKKALLEYCRDHKVPGLMFIDATKIELAHEAVGDNCRMLYSVDSVSPYKGDGDPSKVGTQKANNGFKQFAMDIAHGRLFLFVGYSKATILPPSIVALQRRFEEYNAEVSQGGNGHVGEMERSQLVSSNIELGGECDMLIVHAEQLSDEDQSAFPLSVQILKALSTHVVFGGVRGHPANTAGDVEG